MHTLDYQTICIVYFNQARCMFRIFHGDDALITVEMLESMQSVLNLSGKCLINEAKFFVENAKTIDKEALKKLDDMILGLPADKRHACNDLKELHLIIFIAMKYGKNAIQGAELLKEACDAATTFTAIMLEPIWAGCQTGRTPNGKRKAYPPLMRRKRLAA